MSAQLSIGNLCFSPVLRAGGSGGASPSPPPTPLPHALDDAEEGCKVVMTDALYINHSYLMVNSH